jgi:hypothetical protein
VLIDGGNAARTDWGAYVLDEIARVRQDLRG